MMHILNTEKHASKLRRKEIEISSAVMIHFGGITPLGSAFLSLVKFSDFINGLQVVMISL